MTRTYEQELAELLDRLEKATGARTVEERCLSLHMILTQYERVKDLSPKRKEQTSNVYSINSSRAVNQ